eukprot:UN19371
MGKEFMNVEQACRDKAHCCCNDHALIVSLKVIC